MSDRPKKPRAPQDPKAPKKPQGKPKHVEASSTPTKQTQPTQRGQQPSSSKEVRRSPRKLEIRASPEQGRSKPSGKDAIPEQSEGGSPSSSIRRTTRDEPVTHSQAKLPIRDAGLTALDDPTLTTPAPMTRELQDLGGLREQIVANAEFFEPQGDFEVVTQTRKSGSIFAAWLIYRYETVRKPIMTGLDHITYAGALENLIKTTAMRVSTVLKYYQIPNHEQTQSPEHDSHGDNTPGTAQCLSIKDMREQIKENAGFALATEDLTDYNLLEQVYVLTHLRPDNSERGLGPKDTSVIAAVIGKSANQYKRYMTGTPNVSVHAALVSLLAETAKRVEVAVEIAPRTFEALRDKLMGKEPESEAGGSPRTQPPSAHQNLGDAQLQLRIVRAGHKLREEGENKRIYGHARSAGDTGNRAIHSDDDVVSESTE